MNKSVEPSCTEVFQRVSHASLLTLGAAVAFGLFFELTTQVLTIRQASPFAGDPFDAIGTLTIQIVCAVGMLTFVRSVVLHARGNDSWWRQVLILRGSLVTLTAIVATLIADSIAEFQSSSWGLSAWGTLLVVGLALVTGVTLVAMWTFIQALRSIHGLPLRSAEVFPTSEGKTSLTSTLDDLWSFAQLVGMSLLHVLPWLVPAVQGIGSLGQKTGLMAMMSTFWHFIRKHPWGLCFLVALVVGAAMALGHYMTEGAAAIMSTTILVGLFFFGTEVIAIVLGFLLLGGFLGLRPPLKRRRGV